MIRIDFRMPALGADMESGTLTQWLKKPGERIRRGEALAVVETTKGLIDVEAFDDGVLEELIAQPGATVLVGAVLARIASESAAGPTSSAAAAVPLTMPQTQPGAGSAAPSVQVSPSSEGALPTATAAPPRQRISPAARRRAQELGIDLGSVAGSGPEGVVRIEDVERLATPAPAAPQRAGMRATIGAAMSRSKREIPHYYLAHTVRLRCRARLAHPATTRAYRWPSG